MIEKIYYDNGRLYSIKHYYNGKIHNNEGPAEIIYSHDGRKISEIYYIDNKKHREDGPAVIIYDDYINSYMYYINGIKISSSIIEENPDILIDKNLRKILL